mgnify:FL=1
MFFKIDNQTINLAHVVRVVEINDGSIDIILIDGVVPADGDMADAVRHYFENNTVDLNDFVLLKARQKARMEQADAIGAPK